MYGAWVATDAVFGAVLQHGTWDRYDFVTIPSRRESTDRLIRDRRPTGARVLEFSELRSRDEDLGITVWFESSIDARTSFYIRDHVATRPFPISMLHHTVSYQSSLHNHWLFLLSATSLPCDTIICPTTASKRSVEVLLEQVSERFNARHGTELSFRGDLEVIPLGVDTDLLRPRDPLLARRELGLPTEPLIVLWLGRISAVDKADLAPLLHAFADVAQYARILDLSRPLLLVIAGADPHEQRTILEELARRLGISQDVRIYPYVDAFRKASFYAAADIFIAPTDNIQETFGITPIEAMACGVPQIVSDWNGYRDTVAHDETGFLIPTLWAKADDDLLDDPLVWQDLTDHAELAQSVAVDPTELRSALTKLVLNEDLRNKMGEASRRRACELFSWASVVSRLEHLWMEQHHIAESLEAPPAPRTPEYYRPFFFDAFRHYATRIVEDDATVARTPSGTAALETEKDLAPKYGDLDPSMMRQALEHIDDAGIAIADVLQRLRGPEANPHLDPVLRRQVMRLVKYGYVQLR